MRSKMSKIEKGLYLGNMVRGTPIHVGLIPSLIPSYYKTVGNTRVILDGSSLLCSQEAATDVILLGAAQITHVITLDTVPLPRL